MQTFQVTKVDGLGGIEDCLSWRAEQGINENRDTMETLLTKSDCYVVTAEEGPIVFVGLVPAHLLSNRYYIWILPLKALAGKHIRGLKKLLESYDFGFLLGLVATGRDDNERFAELFGFTKDSDDGKLTTYVRSF